MRLVDAFFFAVLVFGAWGNRNKDKRVNVIQEARQPPLLQLKTAEKIQ